MLKGIARRLLARDLDRFEHQLRLMGEELDALRSRMDLDPELVEAFHRERKLPTYQAAYEAKDPLISVCVATFNRAKLLTERCLPSILRQTHRNLEILVVGDACTDDTAERIQALGDPRIRFENLTERGRYPEDPHRRWMVAGTVPINRCLELATGAFITHLDDDDEFPERRMEELLALVRARNADLAWHPFEYEDAKGRWKVNEAREFRKNQVTTSSIFYHAWLKRIPWDMEAHQYLEPGDWNRLRKLRFMGARVVRHPDCLLKHYRERSNAK